MTAPRPGDPFQLDLGPTAIAGHYLEVDPPHRLVIGWDLPRSDNATPASAVVEITLTPTDDGTDVKVQLSGLSADDAAFHQQLWARHLDRIAAAFAARPTPPTELAELESLFALEPPTTSPDQVHDGMVHPSDD